MGARLEAFVADLLPSLGLTPLAFRYKIIKEGVEVGEVDILARDDSGKLYAVEVKAGRIDVSGVRQAYVNALLAGARPLVVARGYADDAARKLAEELGVEVFLLPDFVFLSIDDLVNAFYLAFVRAFASALSALADMGDEIAEALAECPDFNCFCSKVRECEDVIKKLTKRLPASYDALRNLALVRLAFKSLAPAARQG